MIEFSLQPGQAGEGMHYNVRKPLPDPIHVDQMLACTWGDQGMGKLLGFQEGDVQTVVLHVEDFKEDPQKAVGLHPVFLDRTGMFNLDVPLTDVSDHRSDQ